jgi:hypothetical protein
VTIITSGFEDNGRLLEIPGEHVAISGCLGRRWEALSVALIARVEEDPAPTAD